MIKKHDYNDIDERYPEIDLGKYSSINTENDWQNGIDRIMTEVFVRIKLDREEKKEVKKLLDVVKSNPTDFSSYHRVGLVGGVIKLATEKKNDEIKKKLNISVATIDNIAKIIYEKL